MKNEVVVRLCFWDVQGSTLEEVSHLLGVEPSRVHRQGEPKHARSPVRWEGNDWFLDATPEKHAPFDVQRDALLDFLEAHHAAVKDLSGRSPCEISCALFVHADNGESTPWVHLDARYHRLASELGIAFDLDLYC